MPRVNSARKNRAGKEYTCGRCGRKINPGEKYFFWEPRYGGKKIRCKDHYPRQSELTTSKMSEVYAAIEDVEDTLASQTFAPDSEGDFTSLLANVAEVVTNVAEEYREAAEHFGGAGENAERADELESFAYSLESFDIQDPAAFWEDHPDLAQEDAAREWVEYGREQVQEALGELTI